MAGRKAHGARAPRALFSRLVLFNADCLDLLFRVSLGLESRRSNLDPGGFSWTSFDDLALLRRLFLDDVIVGTAVDVMSAIAAAARANFFSIGFVSPGTSTTNKSSGHLMFPQSCVRPSGTLVFVAPLTHVPESLDHAIAQSLRTGRKCPSVLRHCYENH